MAGILHPGNVDLRLPLRSRHPRTLGHHDRSSSAPNVCLNSVNIPGEEGQRSLSLTR